MTAIFSIINWVMGLLGMLATLGLVVSIPGAIITFIVESVQTDTPGQLRSFRWSIRFLILGLVSFGLLALIVLGWGLLIYFGGMGA